MELFLLSTWHVIDNGKHNCWFLYRAARHENTSESIVNFAGKLCSAFHLAMIRWSISSYFYCQREISSIIIYIFVGFYIKKHEKSNDNITSMLWMPNSFYDVYDTSSYSQLNQWFSTNTRLIAIQICSKIFMILASA